MKAIRKTLFLGLIILFYACVDKNESSIVDNEQFQNPLPDNIKDVYSVDSFNSDLNLILNDMNVKKSELEIENTRLIKFKKINDISAFLIPKTQLDSKTTSSLIIYFKNINPLRYEAIVHKVKSKGNIPESDNQKQILEISGYQDQWVSTKTYINGRLIKDNFNGAQRITSGVCTIPEFVEVDSDGNGLISSEEFTIGIPLLPSSISFSGLDSNGDGSIGFEEYAGLGSCVGFCIGCLETTCNIDPDCAAECSILDVFDLCLAAFLATCATQCL